MGDGEKSEDQTAEETVEESHDLEALRTTHEEARAVIDHQIDAINDVDDKAAYSLRLNILLLGLLLTISSLMIGNQNTPPIQKFVNPIVGLGVICSGLSIVAAIWAYTSTRTETGPGPNDIELYLEQKYDQEEWLDVLVRNYARWMRQNARSNRRDSSALFVSHLFLFLQMGYYALGIGWGLYVPNTTIYQVIAGTALFTIVQLVLLFFPRLPIGNRVFEGLSKRFSKIVDLVFGSR
jgi:hypothetical protein